MKKINLPILAAGILFLSFYGYFIAYTYEASYLSAYDIPSFLVQISLNTIFLATIYASIILIITSVVIIKLLPLLNSLEKKLLLYPLMFSLIMAGIIIPTFVILFPDSFSFVPIIIILIFIIITFTELVVPIIKSHTLKNFKKQIIADRLARNRNKPHSSFTIKNEYYKFAFIVFGLLFVTFVITNTIANMKAQLNLEYYVFKNNGVDYALIRSYGEENLAVKYKSNFLVPGEICIFKSDNLKLYQSSMSLQQGI